MASKLFRIFTVAAVAVTLTMGMSGCDSGSASASSTSSSSMSKSGKSLFDYDVPARGEDPQIVATLDLEEVSPGSFLTQYSRVFARRLALHYDYKVAGESVKNTKDDDIPSNKINFVETMPDEPATVSLIVNEYNVRTLVFAVPRDSVNAHIDFTHEISEDEPRRTDAPSATP